MDFKHPHPELPGGKEDGFPERRRMKRLRLAAILIMVLVCRGAAFSGPMPAAVSNKNLRVELDQKPFALRIMDSSGKILLQTEGRIAFTTVRDQSSPFAKGKATPNQIRKN
jgi:hypothetical protein